MLNSMMKKASAFCNPSASSIKELQAEYIVAQEK